MIYIDPPYNTSHDFVYKDDFSQSADEYSSNSGQYDDQGNRLVANTESNGRFHTDWLNMMYPRLRLAKDLLSEDGIIFISIDDNEFANLEKICDEIFSTASRLGTLVWKRRSGANDAKSNLSENHEYVLVYGKSPDASLNGITKNFENYMNPDNDPRGPWIRDNLTCGKTASQRPNLTYSITDPVSGFVYKVNPDHVWRFEKSKMEELIKVGKVIFPKIPGKGVPAYKRHRTEIRSDVMPFSSIVDTKLNTVATRETRDLFNSQVFDYPKTLDLMMTLLTQGSDADSVILDFFSGSATVSHAVMKLNAKDGGHRKFIMVQLPEKCDEKSEAYKAGYKNICEIGKERIRRAGKQILDELKERNGGLLADEISLDIGFRDLKLDSSNMNDIYYTPEAFSQDLVDSAVSNIKEDRTAEDLLFQVMLDLGIFLSAAITEDDISGKKVFNVENNHLIACFDDDIDENVIIEIAKRKPTYFVMRDSSLANDSVSVNFDQIFARYSPDTIRKVI